MNEDDKLQFILAMVFIIIFLIGFFAIAMCGGHYTI